MRVFTAMFAQLIITWQVCCCFVDVPTSSIRTRDDARVWFGTVLRDFSGDVDVFITEQAALGLAAVASRTELLDRFRAGSLQFAPSGVRGGKTVCDGRVEYRIVEAETCTLARSISQKARGALEPMKIVGRTSGAVVPSAL